MGCFGKHTDNDFFGGCGWIIILAIIFFCCNGNGNIFSDFCEDNEFLIWLAILLLLIFLCCDGDDNCD